MPLVAYLHFVFICTKSIGLAQSVLSEFVFVLSVYLKKRTAICSFVKTFNKALNLLTKSVLGVVRGLFQKTPPHFPILFPFSEEDADFRIRSLLYSDFFPRSSERIFFNRGLGSDRVRLCVQHTKQRLATDCKEVRMQHQDSCFIKSSERNTGSCTTHHADMMINYVIHPVVHEFCTTLVPHLKCRKVQFFDFSH